MKTAIATWSGGKDSCFALYKAQQKGFEISYMANTISHDYRRVRFHGLPAKIITMQSEALSIPLLQKETNPETYERQFIANLQQGASTKHIDVVVFGDIHLKDCLQWAQSVCQKLGVEAFEPLWQMKQDQILRDFIKAGFVAIIVSTQAELLGPEWIGRQIDDAFVKDIQKLPHIDPCGENGEYHTLVVDGPIFNKRLEIVKAKPTKKSGYWFLDIQDFYLTDKKASSSGDNRID